LPGGGGRWWIAWSLQADEGAPPRLFAAELGVAHSTIEIAQPADGRAYAECLCAILLDAGGAERREGLAITVAASQQSAALPDFSPVLFLDVARLFERR
jgi:hypothetical protein